MSTPTVSVVVPCYNGSRYLRETLESALNQTRAPLEVIVVDDGSTDDSAAIAESFGPPVRLIRQQNRGESAARNTGLHASRGDFVTFLDADDLWTSDALERLAAAVADAPGAIGIIGTGSFFGSCDNVEHVQSPVGTSLLPAVFGSPLGAMHSLLIPRDLAVEVGGFAADIRYGEDWEFWLQLALRDRPLAVARGVGALHRRHHESQSQAAPFATQRVDHAKVVQRLLAGMTIRPNVLAHSGAGAFWTAWYVLASAREGGVAWADLKPLTDGLWEFCKTRVSWSQSVRAARLVSLLGPKTVLNVDSTRQRFARRLRRANTVPQTS